MHATVSYFNVILTIFVDLRRMSQSCCDVLYFGPCITCKEGKFDVDRHVCTLSGRGGRGGVCEGSMDFTSFLQGCCDFLQPGGCDHISGNLDFSRVLGLLAVSRVTCDVQLGRKSFRKALRYPQSFRRALARRVLVYWGEEVVLALPGRWPLRTTLAILRRPSRFCLLHASGKRACSLSLHAFSVTRFPDFRKRPDGNRTPK